MRPRSAERRERPTAAAQHAQDHLLARLPGRCRQAGDIAAFEIAVVAAQQAEKGKALLVGVDFAVQGLENGLPVVRQVYAVVPQQPGDVQVASGVVGG